MGLFSFNICFNGNGIPGPFNNEEAKKLNKKSQLAEFAYNWIVGLIILFIIIIFSMIWYKPWQTIDEKISPMIDTSYAAGGKNVSNLPPQFRKNQQLIPVIFIGGVIVILVLISLKQDPNRPYQYQ